MNTAACLDRLEALGFTFQLAPGDVVRAVLPGGIPAPPEAAPLLEYLRANRSELVNELRYRARPRAPLAGRQTKLEPPAPPLEPLRPDPDRPDARCVEELRAALDALLEDAEARAAELTEAEAEAINTRYLALSDALRAAQECPF